MLLTLKFIEIFDDIVSDSYVSDNDVSASHINDSQVSGRTISDIMPNFFAEWLWVVCLLAGSVSAE